MAAFIDPAQSFSNALNQGLGIMKSYRDEARLDEDRSFDRMMKERNDARAQTATDIMVKTDQREGDKHKEWLEGAGDRKRATQLSLEGSEISNKTAQKNFEWIDPINQDTLLNNKTDRAYKMGSLRNDTVRVGIASRQQALAEKAAADERDRQDTMKHLRGLVSAIQNNDWSGISNNPKAASKVTQFAALAVNSPALAEAIQNPFGNWRNDPNKVNQVLPFAQINIGKTAQNRGYDSKGARVVQMTTEKRKNAQGKEEVAFKFGIEGVNKKTGKKEIFWAYQKPEVLLDRAAVFQKTFGAINRDPRARVGLARAYEAADPDGFEMIMEQEYGKRQQRAELIKSQMGAGMVNPQAKRQLQAQLSQLYGEMDAMQQRDPAFMTNLVFNSLGRIGSMQ